MLVCDVQSYLFILINLSKTLLNLAQRKPLLLYQGVYEGQFVKNK
jgi:hypothetical protein